ncbi:hypothetical protein HPB50_023181 [Hyalomma asiaticum]|uniref:Uncharacterized protein n=1 Tax=Hyalomma asiaticum TaxID=266040 RepID=A0ACB7TPE5_HYAAI|nr:hypothetical protein HPB50_023181 [Hyalomma asiaticum]
MEQGNRKPQNRRQTRASTPYGGLPARNTASASLPHHRDARSLCNPPAWTSRLRSLQPNLQAAAPGTWSPGQANEESSPAGSEQPRPNEAARVMMHRATRDLGSSRSPPTA